MSVKKPQTAITLCVCPVVYEFTPNEARDHKCLNNARRAIRALGVRPTALREWMIDVQRDAKVHVINKAAGVRVDVNVSVFEQDDDAPYCELEGRSTPDFMTHHFGPEAQEYVAPRLSAVGVERMCTVATVARVHVASLAQQLGMPQPANDNRPCQRGPRCPECGRPITLPAK